MIAIYNIDDSSPHTLYVLQVYAADKEALDTCINYAMYPTPSDEDDVIFMVNELIVRQSLYGDL